MESYAFGGTESRTYYSVVRKFPSGQFEMVTRVVKPSQERKAGGVPIHLQVPRVLDEEERAERDAENRVRSKRRACRRVRFLCKGMSADHLLTLTTREAIADVERFKKIWDAFVRRVRVKYPEWAYVVAREIQPERLEKRGETALHLHVGVHGRQDIEHLRRCWYQALGGTGKETGEKSPGGMNVKGPRRRWDSNGVKWREAKLAAYLAKYIGKDLPEGEGGKKAYWVSKGILVPEPVRVWIPAESVVDAVIQTVEIAKRMGVHCDLSVSLTDDYSMAFLTGKWIPREVPF